MRIKQKADSPKLDGHNIVPIIKDKKAKSNHSRLHFAWGNQWAVREGEWKLIGNVKNSNVSLHNLSDKEPEAINYVKDKPDLVNHLLSLHDAWAKDVSPKENDQDST